MSMTLCDAHCHIHDDATNERMIAQLQAGKVALMGVREDDFQNVARCAALAPDKVTLLAVERIKPPRPLGTGHAAGM